VNCFFIQPIPVPNGALSLCIVDVVETEERGTIDLATGAIDITEHHASRVYLTSNAMSPCPRCVNGLCVGGKNAGGACTAVGSAGTSIDCLPADRAFITALQLHEFFTTGASEKADFGAGFCADQTAAGAFGRTDAVRVTAAGAPGPQIGDGQPHDIVLAGVFCVPPTGTPPIDALVKLPGPGVVSSAAVLDLD